MKKIAILFLAVVMVTALTSFCHAELSLAELQAKVATLKTGPDGSTEAQVRALLGEPKSVKDGDKFTGMRDVKRKLLYYGPNEEITIVIDSQYGYLRAVK